jgi:hypothetical protein
LAWPLLLYRCADPIGKWLVRFVLEYRMIPYCAAREPLLEEDRVLQDDLA